MVEVFLWTPKSVKQAVYGNCGPGSSTPKQYPEKQKHPRHYPAQFPATD